MGIFGGGSRMLKVGILVNFLDLLIIEKEEEKKRLSLSF